MIRLPIIATLIAAGLSSPALAEPTVATDKVAHFSTAAVVTAGLLKGGQGLSPEHGRITWRDRLIASGITLSLGVAKEILDQRRKGGPFDTADLVADTGGIIVGNLLEWEF